jgi:hypothetical protein
MKKHYIDRDLSLQRLIFNLSTEMYSVVIENFDNIYFEHKTRKDVIIKPIMVEIDNHSLKSIYDHFLLINPDIKIESIETDIYDYVVAIIEEDNSIQENKSEQRKINILNISLTELMSLQEKSEFTSNDKNWSIFEYVSDVWEPSVINEVENMDLPID